MSIPPKPRSDDSKRRAELCVIDCLDNLAIGLKAVVPAQRQAVYLQALNDLMIPQIKYGFDQALKHFIPGYGIDFPPPAMLRDWCVQWRDEAPAEALTRPSKPASWEELGRRAGFSQSEIAGMLEAGRRAQRQHMALLEADPNWRAMAERLGARPGLNAKLVATEVPEGDARKPWAAKKALEQGWLEAGASELEDL